MIKEEMTSAHIHDPKASKFPFDESMLENGLLPTGEGPDSFPEPILKDIDMEMITRAMTPIEYCYSEDKILDDVKQYVDATYGQHYSQNRFEASEFIMDSGHGIGFCLGNVLKYAQRYGKKNGFSRKDLMKIIHYAIMAVHVHDNLAEVDAYIDVDKRTD